MLPGNILAVPRERTLLPKNILGISREHILLHEIMDED